VQYGVLDSGRERGGGMVMERGRWRESDRLRELLNAIRIIEKDHHTNKKPERGDLGILDVFLPFARVNRTKNGYRVEFLPSVRKAA